MKKAIYSIAAAAFAAFFLTACGGDTTTSQASTASASTSTASSASQEVKIEDQKELTCDRYTIKVPEGWKARSRMVNSSCVIGYKEPPFTTASPNTTSEDIESYKKARLDEGSTAIDDITAGGKTFNVFFNDKQKDNTLAVAAATATDKGGTFYVTLRTGASQMSKDEAKEALMKNLKEILDAVTLK